MTLDVKGLITRYLLLLVIGIFGIALFYYLFFTLTFLPVYFILDLFYNDLTYSVVDRVIINGSKTVSIIDACIAGAAYYLLLTLNLTTPMPKKTRWKSILFIVFVFYILNLVRIVVFSSLYFEDFILFYE